MGETMYYNLKTYRDESGKVLGYELCEVVKKEDGKYYRTSDKNLKFPQAKVKATVAKYPDRFCNLKITSDGRLIETGKSSEESSSSSSNAKGYIGVTPMNWRDKLVFNVNGNEVMKIDRNFIKWLNEKLGVHSKNFKLRINSYIPYATLQYQAQELGKRKSLLVNNDRVVVGVNEAIGEVLVLSSLPVYLENKGSYHDDGLFQGVKFKSVELNTVSMTPNSNCHSMFRKCGIALVTLNSLNASYIKDFSYMFEGAICNQVSFFGIDTRSAEHMGSMFSSATIDKLYLTNLNTSNVKNMDNMFYKANIGLMDMRGLQTSRCEVFRKMFEGYRSASRELDVSTIDTSNAYDASEMFKNARVIIRGTERLDFGMANTVDSAFENTYLQTGDFRNMRLDNARYANNLFKGCHIRGGMSLPRVTSGGVTTADKMFYGCDVSGGIDMSNFEITKYMSHNDFCANMNGKLVCKNFEFENGRVVKKVQ